MRLNPESIDLATLRQLWTGAEARLDNASMSRVFSSAAVVERIVAGGETVYGVNTGFGLLANTRIPDERLAELQTNLILSHSAGLGDPLPRHVVRLMIVIKLLGLGRGHSGVRPLVIEALQRLLAIVARIKAREGVEAVILGGTELPLILRDPMASGIPLLDTTVIHARAIVARAMS